MSIMGLFFLHDDLFVDTFFFLSGFLSATSFNKFKNFPNPLLVILKRYVRQVLSLAYLLFRIKIYFETCTLVSYILVAQQKTPQTYIMDHLILHRKYLVGIQCSQITRS